MQLHACRDSAMSDIMLTSLWRLILECLYGAHNIVLMCVSNNGVFM